MLGVARKRHKNLCQMACTLPYSPQKVDFFRKTLDRFQLFATFVRLSLKIQEPNYPTLTTSEHHRRTTFFYPLLKARKFNPPYPTTSAGTDLQKH
jgi:hypothetical protein